MSKVLELRKLLLEKEEALKNAENPQYKTSCMFRPEVHSQRGAVNVKLASATEILEAYKSIRNHEEAAKELGLDTKHLGYTVAEWKEDFKTRIAVISRDETLTEIARIKQELEPLMTVKEKRQVGIEDLADKIKDIV